MLKFRTGAYKGKSQKGAMKLNQEYNSKKKKGWL